ncbi:MAG: carbon monoxide dehydrogenase, small subunit [Acidobacteria bacterium]|nr:carbon monoxide dehydrogenase, small subunit [Acidobacteriota bacterium]
MKRGMSRRRFMTSVGAGVTTAAAVAAAPRVARGSPVAEAGRRVDLVLQVNGSRRRIAVEPRTTLIEAIRDGLGLTGTKPGCERGECGACTVLIDGRPRYACMMLALEAEGAEVTTVEGLMRGEALGAVQQAFVEHDAFQCGYCTSGQVMAVEGLLRQHADPSLEQIRQGLAGNLCRCGAYAHIFAAAKKAATLKGTGR